MQSKSIVQLTTHVDTNPSYDYDPYKEVNANQCSTSHPTTTTTVKIISHRHPLISTISCVPTVHHLPLHRSTRTHTHTLFFYDTHTHLLYQWHPRVHILYLWLWFAMSRWWITLWESLWRRSLINAVGWRENSVILDLRGYATHPTESTIILFVYLSTCFTLKPSHLICSTYSSLLPS